MNTFGTLFRLSVFENHTVPGWGSPGWSTSGYSLVPEDFAEDINRRKGRSGYDGQSEKDVPRILSGLYKGFTWRYTLVHGI